MRVFPRPDIAAGIFFDYLRYDDPISPELRERVVDGFPFLLAPLVQVKGVNFGDGQQRQKAPLENPLFRAMNGLLESASSHASSVAGILQRSASDAASHAGNAAKSFADSAFQAGKELDRRRDLLFRHAATLPHTMAKIPQTVASMPHAMAKLPHTIAEIPHSVAKIPQTMAKAWADRGDRGPIELMSDWLNPPEPPEQQHEEIQQVAVQQQRKESLGRAFGYPLSRWFSDAYTAPDEIGLKILPTMSTTRRVFLAFVHVYLLLLLIVSFPDSYTTRTKFVVRKSKEACSSAATSQIDASSVASDSETEGSWYETSVKEAEPTTTPCLVESRSAVSQCLNHHRHHQEHRILSPCPTRQISSSSKFSRRGMLFRARKALRPSTTEEIQEASVGPANGRLKRRA